MKLAPSSKRATQEILTADFGVDIHLDRIYRMMDSLIEKQDEFQKKNFSVYSISLLRKNQHDIF